MGVGGGVFLDSLCSLGHAEIIEGSLSKQLYSLPSAPAFLYNRLNVIIAGVVRIQNKKLDLSRIGVVIDPK